MANFPTIAIGLPFVHAGGLDADAAAFLTAAGITDATITSAINRLVLNYKGQGNLNNSVDIWSNTSIIYPFVGDSASSHKFNLKNPLDTDAAFRLLFSGGWTHSANGALPNGINAYADSFFQPNLLNQNSARYGYYSRTQYNATNQCEIGCFNSGNSSGVTVGVTSSAAVLGGVQYGRVNETAGTFMQSSNLTTLGWFMSNRRASNIENIWKNKTKQQELTNASVAPNAVNVQFACQNNNGVQSLFSSKQMAFGVIGQGLSDANQNIEYDIIQQFQTDLSRNV
jgi:hypothetical protein